MKQVLLATAAALALTFPAMAQNNMQQKEPNQQTQMQGSQTNAQQRVNPAQLSKQQVRQIQMSLNKKGMNAGHVDGVWGPKTATAMRNFQKKESIKANGHLTQQTLAALGVNLQPNKQKAQSQNKMNRNAQNQKPNQKGTVGAAPSGTTGQGSDMNSNMNSNSSNSSNMNQPNHNSNTMKSSPSSRSGNMGKPSRQ